MTTRAGGPPGPAAGATTVAAVVLLAALDGIAALMPRWRSQPRWPAQQHAFAVSCGRRRMRGLPGPRCRRRPGMTQNDPPRTRAAHCAMSELPQARWG
jgi:hypothetical protein